ncbi:MAG: hypothetical protein LC708_00885, partial [Actinobacteria bacterium]|nr:hypothetical protein [Actinomycetota bacterium]
VVDARLKPIERFIVFIPSFPSLAADRGGGRLYASFHDGRLGDPDVLVWRSSDRGSSWSDPERVNDTRAGDDRAQYLPKLAVAPNGRLDVLYYDRRRDRRNRRNEVSLQSSFDEGESFAKRLRLSERPFSSRVGFGAERGMPDLGSRLGLASADTAALGVWTDTRAGTRASKKQDLAAGFVAFSRPARMSAFAENALRLGGVALVLLGLALLASLVLARRLAGFPRSQLARRAKLDRAAESGGVATAAEEESAAEQVEEADAAAGAGKTKVLRRRVKRTRADEQPDGDATAEGKPAGAAGEPKADASPDESRARARRSKAKGRAPRGEKSGGDASANDKPKRDAGAGAGKRKTTKHSSTSRAKSKGGASVDKGGSSGAEGKSKGDASADRPDDAGSARPRARGTKGRSRRKPAEAGEKAGPDEGSDPDDESGESR